MTNSLPSRFLIVDDDEINNMIISHQLKTAISGDVEIVSFTLPSGGLEYISNYKLYEQEVPTVLFLDLNMPVISGWDFLERFIMLDETIKRQFKIFIVSSSVDDRDINRAKEISVVNDYLTKPLSPDKLTGLFKR